MMAMRTIALLACFSAVGAAEYTISLTTAAPCASGTQQVSTEAECHGAALSAMMAAGLASGWGGNWQVTGSPGGYVGGCIQASVGNGIFWNGPVDGRPNDITRGQRVCVAVEPPVTTASGVMTVTQYQVSAKEQVTDSAEWFSKQAKTWNECAVTNCKYDLTTGETQVFSNAAHDPTHYLRRSKGSLDRSIQTRNRAMLNDNDNYGSEHYHCEHDASHLFQCKCSCSDETNCYSVKHSDRHVKVCDGQAAETQYLLSKNHKTTITAIDNDKTTITAVNVCSCPGGTPRGADSCTTHNAIECASCTGNFHGTTCTTCAPGYHANSLFGTPVTTCAPNVCSCSNGTPRGAGSCTTHNAIECVWGSCDSNYHNSGD
jgi:hypothetical protein